MNPVVLFPASPLPLTQGRRLPSPDTQSILSPWETLKLKLIIFLICRLSRCVRPGTSKGTRFGSKDSISSRNFESHSKQPLTPGKAARDRARSRNSPRSPIFLPQQLLPQQQVVMATSSPFLQKSRKKTLVLDSLMPCCPPSPFHF